MKNIVAEIVKVIEIQQKKLGNNEVAITKTQLLILSKALPQMISKVNLMVLFEGKVRTNNAFDKEFIKCLAQIIGFVSRVGGLTKF